MSQMCHEQTSKANSARSLSIYIPEASEALIVLTIQDDKVLDDSIVKTGRRIRDVAQTPDGSMLLLTDGDNAELLRLTPSGEKEAG